MFTVSCIQMDMKYASPEENFARAEALVREAAGAHPDVIVLPEMWNVGFFPRKELPQLADESGGKTRALMSKLAAEYGVHIVAGSVADSRPDGIYNTAYIFDRTGRCLETYDKTHLFTAMGEHERFRAGNRLARFTLDGVRCGIVICYDIRFPELTRSLAVEGLDLLFVPAQWPDLRIPHLHTLTRARAIENQMFVACCNSCGHAHRTVFGGRSVIWDPWGEPLAEAGGEEETITAGCDLSVLSGIRNDINVFRDRRPELYQI